MTKDTTIVEEKKDTTKDMTIGSPMKHILAFTIPMLFGYLFQQFYSLVDTLIVGKYLGVDDLAAVGSTGSVNFLVIGFCMGVCSGFAIPVAQKFGEKKYEDMRKYVANILWCSIVAAIFLTIITVIFCRQILELMQTPKNIIDDAYGYIVIIFWGIPCTILYNSLAGIIRALGDSKSPVIFLVISAVLNIGLDLLLMMPFQMGVAGAALATVISQGISGVLCLFYMIKKFEILHIKKNEWKAEKKYIVQLCSMGVPMGLQYSITAIGSVILQAAVNSLGSYAVAAMTAGGKMNMFLSCPYEAMGATMATYGGQNAGAGKLDRIGEGLKDCLILGIAYGIVAFLATVFLGKYMALIFLDKKYISIIGNVELFLRINAGFYFGLAGVNIIRFLIQGIGFPKFAVLAGVFEMIARAGVGFLLVPAFGFTAASLGSPIAWILANAFLIPAYFYCIKTLKKKQFS